MDENDYVYLFRFMLYISYLNVISYSYWNDNKFRLNMKKKNYKNYYVYLFRFMFYISNINVIGYSYWIDNKSD